MGGRDAASAAAPNFLLLLGFALHCPREGRRDSSLASTGCTTTVLGAESFGQGRVVLIPTHCAASASFKQAKHGSPTWAKHVPAAQARLCPLLASTERWGGGEGDSPLFGQL